MPDGLMVHDPDTLADAPGIINAIDYMVDHYLDQPSLDEVADVAGQSPFHFQRSFKRRVGISPKRFGQYLTVNHAKQLLDSRASVLDAALDSGLSGPSRLHDLFIACEAMTPGEYKEKGPSLLIRWGLHDAPLGRALIGATDRGICWLGFVENGDEDATIAAFKQDWGLARLVRDDEATRPLAEAAFATNDNAKEPLTLVLRGTNFQVKVWEALLRVPQGAVTSYGDLASWIGQPTASRAVGSAVGNNPIAYLIPCHRVIRNSGAIHNYRWGPVRKRALLAWEAALADGVA